MIQQFLGGHLVFAALDHGLFTLAGNIIRNNILLNEGGIYTDLGALFMYDPTPLLAVADMIVHYRKGRLPETKKICWLDQDVLAAHPHHPVMQRYLTTIDHLHEYAAHMGIQEHFNTPKLMHMWTSARHLTEVVKLFSADFESALFILPDDETLIRGFHQSSWFAKTGDRKNKSCLNLHETSLNWFDITPDYYSARNSPRYHDYLDLVRNNFNVNMYRCYYAPFATSAKEAVIDFRKQGVGVQPFIPTDEQPVPVTVTMTTWPGKVKNAHIAIESLFRQRCQPHYIVLWLADDEFPNHDIPATLTALIPRGLRIEWCTNIRSAKKLIPSLMHDMFQHHVLVTADDDVIYQPTWLEKLIAAHHKNPQAIITHRGRSLTFDADRLLPYQEWPVIKTYAESVGRLIFPTGCGGVLYPPNALDEQVKDTEAFMALCPTGDDIFFFAMAQLKRTPIYMPEDPENIIDINDEAAIKVSLYHSINRKGKNDEMIKKVFHHYGLLDILTFRGSA